MAIRSTCLILLTAHTLRTTQFIKKPTKTVRLSVDCFGGVGGGLFAVFGQGLAEPCAVLPGLDTRIHAFSVARPITTNYLFALVPVGLSTVVALAFFVTMQIIEGNLVTLVVTLL